MSHAVLVDAVRTPIGRFQGGLSQVRPDDLAAYVIRALTERMALDPSVVEEVFFGCANQAGEDNRNVARMALLLAGYPHSVPGITVNRLCASGLSAVNQAARMIAAGDADVCVAGGVEVMSRAPYSMPRGPNLPKAGNVTMWDTTLGWRYPNPKMAELFPLEAMGATAENLVEKYNISREDQDAFAYNSHQKALKAWENGWFDNEVVPVTVPGRKTSTIVDRDESPRADTALDKLATLKTIFRSPGTVTAGNSSPLNDGAAALLIASEKSTFEHGWTPRARIVACQSAGVDPTIMGIGPVPATQKALVRAGWSVDDVDVWELNEAFASQSLAVIRALGLDPDKVNLNGGAIALGHPLGCSGARILTTLLNVMERTGARRGAATLCVGVGQGVCTLIERL
ncbi:MAG: acetyl-CoA acyltransferase [Myxococcota bacterium]|jgi:acetyl-CoA acyltransferase